MANMLLISQAWDATCDFHFSDLEITPWRSSNVKSVYGLDVTCKGQSKSKVKMHFSWAEIYFVPYPFFDKIDILVHISQCYTVPSPHDVWRLDLAYLLRKSVFDTVPSSHFGLILRAILFHMFSANKHSQFGHVWMFLIQLLCSISISHGHWHSEHYSGSNSILFHILFRLHCFCFCIYLYSMFVINPVY